MKKTWKKIMALTAATVFCVSMFAGCTNTAQNGGNGDTIYIGGLAPLTGDVAVYGNANKKGADLAFEEINAKGGVLGKQITFETLDEKGDVNEAITAFNRLVSQNMVAFLGDVTSKPTIAVADLAAQENIPMITATATAAEVTQAGDNIFRVCFLDPTQGKTMAQYAKDKLGATTAAIMYNVSDDYSTGLAKAFEEKAKELGMNIVGNETYNESDKDFKSQLTKIAGSNPDVLFLPDYYNNVALIASQVKEVGIQATLLGADGWDGVVKTVNADNMDSVNGSIFCNHYSAEDPSEKVQTFLTAYKEKYNEDPVSFSALAYDAAYILAQAIEKAGSTDKDAIIQALAETSYDGVTGHISFDSNGDPVKDVSIIKIEDGKYTLAEKVEQAQ